MRDVATAAVAAPPAPPAPAAPPPLVVLPAPLRVVLWPVPSVPPILQPPPTTIRGRTSRQGDSGLAPVAPTIDTTAIDAAP